MKVTLTLTKRETEAVLASGFENRHGVRKSQALASAEFKILSAVISAKREAEARP